MKKNRLTILWPSFLYACLVVFILSESAGNIPSFIVILLSFSAPIVTWVITLELMQKNLSHPNQWILFLFSSIPGALFGLHLSYGFYEAGHGDNPLGAVVPIALVSLFFGFFSGFVGKMSWEIDHGKSLTKRDLKN